MSTNWPSRVVSFPVIEMSELHSPQMPVKHHIDLEASLGTLVVEGELVFEEIRSIVEGLYEDDLFLAGSLFDMRTVTASDVSTSQIRSMVPLIEQRRRHPGPSRWAIVVSHDIDFGLSRMFEVFADKIPTDIRVFRDIDAAKQWLAKGPADSNNPP